MYDFGEGGQNNPEDHNLRDFAVVQNIINYEEIIEKR